jgi:RND superfamily putative drug exporter
VPHRRCWRAPTDVAQGGIGQRIVQGSRAGSLMPVIGAALVAIILLPITIITALLRRFVALVTGGRVKTPSVVSVFDRSIFKPYEVRRTQHEHLADETHGFWKRVGDRVAQRPARVMTSSIVVLLVMCAGLAFFSTDLTTNDGYRTSVESVEGQDLLAQSFPAGQSAPADVIVPPDGDVQAVQTALEGTDGIDAVTGPVAEGEQGTLIQATLDPPPYSTEAFDLIEPIRESASGAVPGTVVGGASAVEFDVREAAGWDSTVIPPIVLVVVFLILVLLLRAVTAPLILIGTVILSFLAALGVGYFAFEFIFDFPGSDPSLPLFAFVFLVALGVDYNIFLMARAREETLKHGTREGVLRALAVTGGVITSAGIVLAGTFSVLAVLPLVFLTEIGFVVAFGVLLDTFLVRSVLVPAIVMKLGPKVWWPSQLAKTDGAGAGEEERTLVTS